MGLCNYVSLGYLPCSFWSSEFPQRLYSISRDHGLVICSPYYVWIFVVSIVASAAIPPFAPPTAYSLMISVMCYCVGVLHLCHEHHVIYLTAISFVLQRE